MVKRFVALWIAILLAKSVFPQVSGFVYDSNTGQPLAGCYVFITELEKATLTDNSGHFSFDRLPHKHLQIEFKFMGYKTVIKDIYLQSDDSLLLKIYMTPVPLKAAEVVVTAFIPGSQHTTAVKIDNLDAGNVTSFSAPSVLSLLKEVPGVDIISKGNGIGSPVIRGLSKTNIVVLNNGFRLEDFQFSENHPFFIDEFGTGKIEIIKGPASLLYGSDAIGGVINVLWEEPAVENTLETDYSLQYHTNSRGVLTSYGLKFSKNGFSTGLRAGYNSNADLRDGQGTQVVNSRFLHQNIKGFSILNTDFGSFKLYYEYSRDKLGLPVEPAFALVTDDSRKVSNFYQDLHHYFLGSRNTFFTGKKSKLKLNFSYEHNRRGLAIYDTLPDPIDMDLHSFNADIKQVVERDKYTLLAGFQGNYVTNRNFGTDVFLPDYTNMVASVYSLVKMRLGKVNLLGGVRYDNTRMDLQFSDLVNGQVDTSLYYASYSGSMGATWIVSDNLIFRLNTASAFRNPNAAELGESGIHAFRYEVGNLNLVPQRSYEADFSVHFHKKAVVFDLAAYYNRILNYIYLSPTENYASNGMRIYTYMQDNALLTGFETGVKVKPLKRIKISSSYAFIYTQKDDKEPLPLIPQNKLRTKLSYMVDGDFEAYLSGVYAFAQNRPGPEELPSGSYFLLNAGVTWKTHLQKLPLNLSVKASNILNEVYNDHLSTLREEGFYDMGRNISLGIKIPLKYSF